MTAIYEALANVMDDVQAVAKKDRNTHQNFNFRGIDAVMNAVGPVLRKHKVIVVPRLDGVTYEAVQTSTGKPATACRVQVAYVFYADDGSHIETSVAGEAWDSGDKACPKAMSVAFRTALLQALCLPTDEPDPDTQTYERAQQPRADHPTLEQLMDQLGDLVAKAREKGVEGDYDTMIDWAAQSAGNARAAIAKIEGALS